MKKTNRYLVLSTLISGIFAMVAFTMRGAAFMTKTEALKNCEEGIYVEPIDGWTSGNRHSGLNFTLDAGSKVTPTENTAIVIDYENLSEHDSYLSFYLNSLATTNRINSTNATPNGRLYLFNDATHVKTYTVSTGTADIYVKNSSIGTYNKMVMKISDFGGVYNEGVETNLTSLFFSTRLNLSNTDRTKADIRGFIKGMYVVEFAGEEANLDLTGATKIYTPAAGTFTQLSGSSDTSSKYFALKGTYAVPVEYEFTDDGHGSLSVDGRVFAGAKVTLNITPSDVSYVLNTLTVNGTDVTADVVSNQYVVENVPSTGLTASVTFKEAEPVDVELLNDGHGALSLNKSPVYAGDTVVISVKPDRYYELDTLIVNGDDVTDQVVDGQYTVVNVPNTGIHANVTFKKTIDYTGEHGKVEFTPYEAGQDTVLSVVPDAGYEIADVKVGGVSVTLNKFNKYLVHNAAKPLNVQTSFRKATTFYMDNASLFSVNNHKLCNVYALWDCVSVKTAVTLTNDTYQYIGLTLDGINKQVTGNENLVIQLQNVDSSPRTFYVDVNGVKAEIEDYYLIDRLGNFISKNGSGLEIGAYDRFENATFNSQYDREGFAGLLVLPLARYGAIDTINSISVRVGVLSTHRARFNLGSIYLDSSLNKDIGWMDEPQETNKIWEPGQNNWGPYITPAVNDGDQPIDYTTQYTRISYLKSGTMVYGLKDEENPESPNYDTYRITFPQNTIGEDGYVDIKGLGIKGIIFDVENDNLEQVQFAIRIAGKESTNFGVADTPIWQTSSSSAGHFAKVIYDNGVVQSRGSKYLPVSSTGHFKGSMYIPLDADGFTKLSSDNKGFPEKIQPVFRVLFADPKDYYIDYAAKITNFRVVTDDTPYQTSTVTMTGPDCFIDARVADLTVKNDANNHLLSGTELIFTVTPNVGYHIVEVICSMGGVETVLVPGADGSYSVIVTDDIVISVRCAANVYKINYNLDGGTNNEENPTSYEYGGLPITLEDPTKEGYTFLGWIDEEGNEITEIDTFAAKDYNLTAKWQSNGGIAKGGMSPTAIIIICAAGGAVLVGGGILAFVLIKKRKAK